VLWRLRDTPQSEGLPSIEDYHDDYPPDQSAGQTHERELAFRELLVEHVLKNRALWLVAFANFFVYIARYAMLDWGPTYLREQKGATPVQGGDVAVIIEFAAIPSTLLMGWLSDRLGGRRGMVSLLCMLPVCAAFAGILYTPPGLLWLDLTLFAVVGFFIYPPVMLLGVTGLDFTSKKAVGAAAGFIGLFGYLGRTVQGKALGWIADHWGWTPALWAILISSFAAIALLSLTWRLKPQAPRIASHAQASGVPVDR
jgi:OPA family glycerol-3-phosphate transporter-like MFS transporter